MSSHSRALALLALLATLVPHAAADSPVVVIVDMDATAPGFQNEIAVPAGQPRVEGVAIHIFDPLASRSVRAIGYVGGIDRGIAFGHVPNPGNRGTVVALGAQPGTPVNPGNIVVAVTEPGLDHAFPGPEIQYVEAGGGAPSIIGPPPGDPVITVDITLSATEPGDVFDFYLLDFVSIWAGGGHGAFSTREPLSLDTGGDAVPDSTHCLYGVDPDSAVAVPPAAYLVDLIDGGSIPGPARIVVKPSVSIGSPREGQSVGLRLTCSSPFTDLARIRYFLPERSEIRLGVYDVEGRRVRRLARSPAREAGEHAAGWDGRDDRGRALPGGVYLLRLEAGHHQASARLVLVR